MEKFENLSYEVVKKFILLMLLISFLTIVFSSIILVKNVIPERIKKPTLVQLQQENDIFMGESTNISEAGKDYILIDKIAKNNNLNKEQIKIFKNHIDNLPSDINKIEYITYLYEFWNDWKTNPKVTPFEKLNNADIIDILDLYKSTYFKNLNDKKNNQVQKTIMSITSVSVLFANIIIFCLFSIFVILFKFEKNTRK